MSIDHGCSDVAVAEEFLDGANIVAQFDESSGKRVAEGMAAAVFGDTGAEDSEFDDALDGSFVEMGSEVLM
jgi:ribosomal protein L35AE/L33A